ncbi:MAG: transposase [Myxococcales bacterium]|nr:transposase [Myxococcales bacterium]
MVPRGVASRRHYSQAAICMALALWGLMAMPVEEVRQRVCAWRVRGAGVDGMVDAATVGELAAAMRALAAERYRPPGSSTVRQISVPTLERWLYAYRRGGLAALRPQPRSDRGRARELTPAQRELLLDIRREYPTASVPLILRTLVADGRLGADVVSATTARLYREAGLERGGAPRRPHPAALAGRPRWRALARGHLSWADAAHRRDDPAAAHPRAARRCIALRGGARGPPPSARSRCSTSCWPRCVVMAPGGLYLDNGSTYSGVALRLCCERLGISLVHARPYDAPARGKMERFWRTLRCPAASTTSAA